ncbi:putative Negative regulator of the PHO system [Seiridium cardinale]|uniref:Negative regulator of the PHO system n=1 Tax=Seiridium cardinale TaxID=138064 RepID=A0ABR2XHD6_9PEZI
MSPATEFRSKVDPNEDDILKQEATETRVVNNPYVDAIRGNSLPTIVVDGNPRTSRSRSDTRSSVASNTSKRTVSDRGDSSYAKSTLQGDAAQTLSQISGTPVDLQRVLYEALVTTEGAKLGRVPKRFFPKGVIDILITPQVVLESIQESVKKKLVLDQTEPIRHMQPEEIMWYADRVCSKDRVNGKSEGYKNMFAILVAVDRPISIIDFVDHKLNDGCLPLERSSVNGGTGSELRRRGIPDLETHCFKEWGVFVHDTFDNWQWSTIAPFFAKFERGHMKIYRLSDKDVLPWTKKYNGRNYSGFSEVYRVKIHKRHHEFDEEEGNDGTFAVKKLRYEAVGFGQSGGSPQGPSTPTMYSSTDFEGRARQEFRNEVEVLDRFSNNAHPHLISLLAAFQRGRDCYLLFHWAESDLLQFWKSNTPRPALEEQNVAWLLDQFHGIAEGLYFIHEYKLTNSSATKTTNSGALYGRHGDIKPQNLLLFKDRDKSIHQATIKITDFGLARFNSENSRSGIRKSNVPGITPTYRPPEMDLEDGRISRSFDIWSLGCVLLEFITWHFGGWDYLHGYVKSRLKQDIHGHKTDQFFEFLYDDRTGQRGVRMKAEVLVWIRDLHKHPSCSELVHDLLTFIEERMLAVLPNDRDEAILPTRATSKDVLDKLKSLKERVTETSYSLTGQARDTIIDYRVIPVRMSSEKAERVKFRQESFDVHRGGSPFSATTRRI